MDGGLNDEEFKYFGGMERCLELSVRRGPHAEFIMGNRLVSRCPMMLSADSASSSIQV
jgi:hypothetical protein